jgi:hypothetical protein
MSVSLYSNSLLLEDGYQTQELNKLVHDSLIELYSILDTNDYKNNSNIVSHTEIVYLEAQLDFFTRENNLNGRFSEAEEFLKKYS